MSQSLNKHKLQYACSPSSSIFLDTAIVASEHGEARPVGIAAVRECCLDPGQCAYRIADSTLAIEVADDVERPGVADRTQRRDHLGRAAREERGGQRGRELDVVVVGDR